MPEFVPRSSRDLPVKREGGRRARRPSMMSRVGTEVSGAADEAGRKLLLRLKGES